MIRHLLLLTLFTIAAQPLCGQTYYFVGAVDSDFFNEGNWNDQADGLGNFLMGDPLMDSSTNAIATDLVIDGDTVEANGQVDFGTGSLTMLGGSSLDVVGAGNDFDINSDSTFSFTDATLQANGDVVFEGAVSMTGGTVVSLTDDVEFQDNFSSLTVDGTSFTSGSGAQTTYFDGFAGSITNASFTMTGRLGLRNSVNVVMTDSTLDVNGGGSDVENIFSGLSTGSSLTLQGASSLVADSMEEDVALILNDDSTATLGGNLVRITADASTITLNSTGASVVVTGPLDTADPDYFDSRPFLINGLTGMTYADDPSAWSDSAWNGIDATTLRLVPEPASFMMVLLCLIGFAKMRRLS